MARPAFANRDVNPYNSRLYSAMCDQGVVVDEYAPWRAARGAYDVVHVHWPESSFNHGLAGALAVTESLLWALGRARARGARVVWTAHNLRAHERRFPAWEDRMWRRFHALVDGVIALSAGGLAAARAAWPALAARPGFVVPHGHYRDAYPPGPGRAAARRALGLADDEEVVLFVGQILAYKNVPGLLRAFAALPGARRRLWIAGRPRSPALADELRAAAAGDARATLELGFVADARLGVLLHAADLVVLPYREILNSGSSLLALSFDTPVLMPGQGAGADLLARVGPAWLRTFGGELDAATLADALAWARAGAATRGPRAPLDGLSWPVLARETIAAYQALVARPR